MLAFLVLAAAMTLLACALVVRALRRPAGPGRGGTWAAMNASVHAAALGELDHELQRGALSVAAHRAACDEVLGRALAEAALPGRVHGGPASPVATALAALVVPLVAAALYLLVGNPAAVVADAAPVAVATPADGAPLSVARLEAHLDAAPRDGRAWVMLARLHMQADRFPAAVRAYEQALAAAPKVAADPLIWCELADALGMAQGGSLRGKPGEHIARALALKPGHPRALEMAGSAAYEAGDLALTLTHWSALLAQLPPGSAEHSELQLALARVQERVGGLR